MEQELLLMIFISNWAYKIWIGDKITIPFGLSAALGLNTILQLILIPYSFFINGIGKLKLTVSITFIEIIIYLILIYVFGNIFKNSTGIVLAIFGTNAIIGINTTDTNP